MTSNSDSAESGAAGVVRARKARRPHGRHSDASTRVDERIASGELPRVTYRKGEAAAVLGISRWHLDTLINSGEVGYVQLGNVTVIPATELDRLVRTKLQRRVRM